MSRDFGRKTQLRCSLAAFCLFLAACASAPTMSARDLSDANDTGRTLAAEDDADRALLRDLPTLKTGSPRRYGSKSVVADDPYTSASGRSCRTLHLTTTTRAPTERLACTDGKSWFFVPDVFGASVASE